MKGLVDVPSMAKEGGQVFGGMVANAGKRMKFVGLQKRIGA